MRYTVSLKKNHEFKRLYRSGQSAVSPYFAVYCRRNRLGQNRLGITTGAKIGNAVKRNRVRRRIREAYRTNEPRFTPGYDIVIVARVRAVHTEYAKLEAGLLRLLQKLGITRRQDTRP